MKKVLVVEDNEVWQLRWKEAVKRLNLEDKLTLVQAFKFSEAQQLIKEESKDTDLVMLDGKISADGDGLRLIDDLALSGYKGHVLAVSASESMNRLMHKKIERVFGTESAHSCEKRFALATTCRILGISIR